MADNITENYIFTNYSSSLTEFNHYDNCTAKVEIQFNAQPTAGDTITLTSVAGDVKTYEFKASGGSDTDGHVMVNIGPNANSTFGALITAADGPEGHNNTSANSVLVFAQSSGGSANSGSLSISQKYLPDSDRRGRVNPLVDCSITQDANFKVSISYTVSATNSHNFIPWRLSYKGASTLRSVLTPGDPYKTFIGEQRH